MNAEESLALQTFVPHNTLRKKEHNKNKLALKLQTRKRKMIKFLFWFAFLSRIMQDIELTAKAASDAA